MKFEYKKNMILLKDDEKIVGSVIFNLNDNTCNIVHTNVNTMYQGKGYASKLVEEVYKTYKEQGYNFTATCSYAKHWLEKNI